MAHRITRIRVTRILDQRKSVQSVPFVFHFFKAIVNHRKLKILINIFGEERLGLTCGSDLKIKYDC
jgi:hypothetical protein